MKLIIDTNVPIVANQRSSPQVSTVCVSACVTRLKEIPTQHILVLDNQWQIMREYMQNLHSSGQPGVGDAFLKWVLTNRANPQRCELVPITPINNAPEPQMFEEFPHEDDALTHFDPSDRKFVAVALAHPDKPPILNAVDTDWQTHQRALKKYGIQIEFLCPQEMQRKR
jgi:hypothetical protein